MNHPASHCSLGKFSSRFSTRSFTRVCLILKDLLLNNFSKMQHFISSHSTQTLTLSLLSYINVFLQKVTLRLCFCIPIQDDFAKMVFLVCCFVFHPPFWFLHLPDSEPVLYQTWAICPQVLIKYQYPKNIFQALTTKDIVLALQLCSIFFWNFFQIICPTLLYLLFECNGLMTLYGSCASITEVTRWQIFNVVDAFFLSTPSESPISHRRGEK